MYTLKSITVSDPIRWVALALGLASFLVASHSYAGEQSTCELPSARIADKNPEVRAMASGELMQMREQLFRDLVTAFEMSEDNSYMGPRHRAIIEMGRWRIEKAVPLLTKHIDWMVAPDGRQVHRRGQALYARFPAVIALQQIGGVAVGVSMVQIAKNTDDEKILALCSFVLGGTYGEGAAKYYLGLHNEAKLGRIERVRARKVIEFMGSVNEALRPFVTDQ